MILLFGLAAVAACDSAGRASAATEQVPVPVKAPVKVPVKVEAKAKAKVGEPGEPRTLAIFFEVSNRGELDPCG